MSGPTTRGVQGSFTGESRDRRKPGLVKRVSRALTGLGAYPIADVAGDYSLIGLPLGGRVVVTGARTLDRQQEKWRWLVGHQQRLHWQALVFVQRGGREPTVQMTLDDWAYLVGKLSRYEQELERISVRPTSDHDRG